VQLVSKINVTDGRTDDLSYNHAQRIASRGKMVCSPYTVAEKELKEQINLPRQT